MSSMSAGRQDVDPNVAEVELHEALRRFASAVGVPFCAPPMDVMKALVAGEPVVYRARISGAHLDIGTDGKGVICECTFTMRGCCTTVAKCGFGRDKAA